MNLAEFDYHLPKDLIAQKPKSVRDESRLMVLNSQFIDAYFKNLPNYLNEGDVLVLNDSKVLNARLAGRKKTGGRVELLLVNFNGRDATCLIRGKRLRKGSVIEIGDVTCEVTGNIQRKFIVRFDRDISDVIEKYGEVPLPHYIKERLETPERYQTVYSRRTGSIAAPTAGLHFTEDLIKSIKEKGVKIANITLHIGPSTFLPIQEGENGHRLDKEYFSIDSDNARIIKEGVENSTLIAVGTTTVKALESASVDGQIVPWEGLSDIFISPGYKFKVPIKGMITNFHLPKSSLLLLVSALFGRERILEAYSRAIYSGYRFYSFGDAMFIKR
jgi:S-adenosylmethionine:tRNA ribosyltransferase-isomerase